MEAASLPKSVAIGVSSIGNFFMTEIGRMLEDAFRELSVPARLFTESEAATVSGDESVVVVAPHEFFVLGNGPEAFEILKRVATLVMVNTEQRQTPWFAVAEPYLRSACAVLDINYQSAQQLTRWGYRAFALPLGYSDYWPVPLMAGFSPTMNSSSICLLRSEATCLPLMLTGPSTSFSLEPHRCDARSSLLEPRDSSPE